MDGREAFLKRVRQAVAEGNRAGAAADVPERGRLGYQGAGPDPVAHFLEQFTAAGGVAHPVHDRAAAVATAVELVRARSARRVLLGHGRLLDPPGLAEGLAALGVEVARMSELSPERARETLFAADVGISEADHLIGETGSLAIAARRDEPRSLSLLPLVHIVLADRGHLCEDLFDLFALLEPGTGHTAGLPSCLTLITGPSKTGDIELRLVTGVHGPGELHVILATS